MDRAGTGPGRSTAIPCSTTPEIDRVSTAYHEAAHALMVHGLGGVILMVDGAGQTSYARGAGYSSGALVESHLHDLVSTVVLYSGPVAEDIARRPDEQPGTIAMVLACRTMPYVVRSRGDDSEDDLYRIGALARRRFDSGSDGIFPYLARAARLTEDLIRTHWEPIGQVAQQALQCGSVDGRLFGRLVNRTVRRGGLCRALKEACF